MTYAGDLSQSIFSFAGADSLSNYQEISKDVTKRVRLVKSFRSAPAVLDTVNTLSSLTMGERLKAAFPMRWGGGGVSALTSFSAWGEEAAWITKTSQKILQECPNQRIGILSRTSYRQSEIKRTLRSCKVVFTDWADGLFRANTARILRDICDNVPEGLLEKPIDLLSFIQNRANVLQDRLSFSDDLRDSCGWLFDQLLNSAPADVKARIVSQKSNETIATRKGVHCLTGHAGKGQQFDWVFIAGLDEGTAPFYKSSTRDEILEEARVLSVMVSRARIGIMMTHASKNLYGYKTVPSRFSVQLQQAPGLLSDVGQVETWLASVDWESIRMM